MVGWIGMALEMESDEFIDRIALTLQAPGKTFAALATHNENYVVSDSPSCP
jgi:hypothetical protein